MATFIYPPAPAASGGATEATLLLVEQNTADTVDELQLANTSLDNIEADVNTLAAVDYATEAKQDAQIVEAVATNASLDTIEADIGSLEAKTAAGLVSEDHDYQAITYVGATTDIDTITYKSGGAGGTTVAVLTMGYDGSNRLTSVTKT